jgi:hypothetical protein
MWALRWVGLVRLRWFWASSCLAFGSKCFCYFLVLFFSFGPFIACFHICPAKYLNPPKLWKMLVSKSYLHCFWWISFEYWWGKIRVKNHQQWLPLLRRCALRYEGGREEWEARVQGETVAAGFDPLRIPLDRRMKINDRDRAGQHSTQAGQCFPSLGLGCALGRRAHYARDCRAGRGPCFEFLG